LDKVLLSSSHRLQQSSRYPFCLALQNVFCLEWRLVKAFESRFLALYGCFFLLSNLHLFSAWFFKMFHVEQSTSPTFRKTAFVSAVFAPCLLLPQQLLVLL